MRHRPAANLRRERACGRSTRQSGRFSGARPRLRWRRIRVPARWKRLVVRKEPRFYKDHRASMSKLPITYDDVAAAHQRIGGVAHRTPVLDLRNCQRCGWSQPVLQVRELPACWRLQISGSLQCHRPVFSRATGSRRHRVFFRQPCAGHCALGEAPRHQLGHRDA